MLINLVNDILDYTKIEETKINIENKLFKVKDIENEVVAMFMDKMREKGLEFIVESNYSENLIAESDKLKISQVIINLISNAFKFTENGSITLKIDCNNKSEDNILMEVEVIDTGIGIEENKLDLVWNDFEQIHNNLSENYNGTGLGLAISRRIVETLGGEVWIKSSVGVGSTFGFNIIIKKSNDIEVALDKSFEENDEVKITKVLIVEDNIINLEIALSILQDMGIGCDEATNGKEAIEICKSKGSNYYDLILMDINMPVMNGYDAVKILRNEYNIKSPVAFMTATILDSSREKEFKDYINGVILKPINPDDIKEKIFNIVKSSI